MPLRIPFILIAGLVGAYALFIRVLNLHATRPYGHEFDEGVFLSQIQLMRLGYRPVRDIFMTQGPLFPTYFWPFFAISDGDLAITRLGAVVASVVVLLAITLIAWRIGGPLAGVAALILAVSSPLLLHRSRLVFAEITSLAPSILSILFVLVFRESGLRRHLALSGLLFALGLLLKPMSAANAAPVLLLLAQEKSLRRAAQSAALWAGTVLGLIVIVVALVGPAELIEPFIELRARALGQGAGGRLYWSLESNLRLIASTLRLDPPWLPIGLVSLVATWIWSRRVAVVLAAWIAAVAAMMALYSPLFSKHIVYLVPPLAILGGVGLSTLIQLVRGRLKARLTRYAALAVCAASGLAITVPALVYQVRTVAFAAADETMLRADADRLDAVALITTLSRPDEVLLTDDHWLAYLSKRAEPPRLVDAGLVIVRSGQFSSSDMIAAAQKSQPALIVFRQYRFTILTEFAGWVASEYLLVKTYDDRRAVYLRRDLADRRASMLGTDGSRSGWRPVQAEVAVVEELQVLGGPASGGYWLEQRWRPLQSDIESPRVMITFRSLERGAVLWQDDEFLLPPWSRAPWQVGETVVMRRPIDRSRLPAGRYQVTARLIWSSPAESTGSAPSARAGGQRRSEVAGTLEIQ